VAVGTGASIEIGKRGDADVVFVHAKELELKAVEEGYFVNRHDVMYNDFVIIGPANDPAKIKGKKAIVPGNHDEKNLGYKLFPEFFGNTDFIRYDGNLTVIGLATSEPDKADGRLGRNRHRLIKRGIEKKKDVTIIGFHHHPIPISPSILSDGPST
jgi:3',5'-cyclic AMP phosphodiesterase CpdA